MVQLIDGEKRNDTSIIRDTALERIEDRRQRSMIGEAPS